MGKVLTFVSGDQGEGSWPGRGKLARKELEAREIKA